MNTILYCSLTKIWSEEIFNQKILLLPQILQQKILVYKDKKEQQLRICGKLMLQQLMHDFNVKQDLNDIKYDSFNKPFLNGNFHFSTAHSEDFVVCVASAKNSVGIDVEKIKSIDVLLLKEIFTSEEWRILELKNYDLNYFYFLWTRKEAVLKAIGKGIFGEMRNVDVLKDEIKYEAQIYYINEISFNAAYKIAIALTNKEIFERREFVI